jgi:protein-S-isoprenylcysteine O-methyltransferase Ste14
MTTEIILFIILSVPVIIISWRVLFNVHSHGFYRFLSWECILWLFACNYKLWFVDAFGIKQLISWFLLIFGAYLVIAGVLKLKGAGNSDKRKDENTLFKFERTTELVDKGIFKYIRHPLYSSLIFLTWGIYFKNATPGLLVVALISTLCLYITARFDEKECIAYFGDKYREYMSRSRMFVPFLF